MITKLPKTALIVISHLEMGKQYTRDEITILSAFKDDKGIKYALRRLREVGILEQVANLKDMRRIIYRTLTYLEIQTSETIPLIIKSQLADIEPISQLI